MRNFILIFTFFLASCNSSIYVFAQNNTNFNKIKPIPVYPIDECKNNKELKDFVDKLKRAIINKDTEYVFSIVADSIILTYNDVEIENDKKFLRKKCKNDTVLNEYFLQPLLRGISLGLIKRVSNNEVEYSFPYVVYTKWYKGGNYGFSPDLCAVDSNVQVYLEPDTTSKVVGRLNYEVVKVNYEKLNEIKNKIKGVTYYNILDNWYYIMKYDNKTSGFVEAKYLYSMMGVRGRFEKIKGKYYLTSFISGD
ncbi:MAG: SH3 domain-containing protein [Bacteroidota bacterium]